MRHFWSVCAEAKREHAATEVESQSVREAEVLNWFYQTRFWSEEKDRSEFTPQFELGRYLKQFDPYYQHPEYRVDFLLLYRPEAQMRKRSSSNTTRFFQGTLRRGDWHRQLELFCLLL